jgi:saccharopine dehydrogenase-like NADP-dependent oxidoreductase
MHQILLLGAGKIGGAIGKFLSQTGDYEILVADASARALERFKDVPNVTTIPLDLASDDEGLARALVGRKAVLSALSYAWNPKVAAAALKAGASYFDLTEDVATTHRVKAVAEKAGPGQIFMPQCGLAPGFVSIVANELATRLETIDTIHMRVGALPMYPTNALKYNLTWSTDGLINEYCNPCEAIHNGKKTEVLALEGFEHFSIDGVRYEAFNTSGGLGTLCETLEGKARMLNYKTVRYPGHRALVDFLVNELKLGAQRETLKAILENAVPMTLQDVVLVFCTVTGQRKGRLTQITDARKIYHSNMKGEMWSAIQITTASGICAVLDLHFEGKLPASGFVRQEQVGLDDFLKNRFGRHYAVDNPDEIPVKLVQGDLETGSWQTLSKNAQ